MKTSILKTNIFILNYHKVFYIIMIIGTYILCQVVLDPLIPIVYAGEKQIIYPDYAYPPNSYVSPETYMEMQQKLVKCHMPDAIYYNICEYTMSKHHIPIIPPYIPIVLGDTEHPLRFFPFFHFKAPNYKTFLDESVISSLEALSKNLVNFMGDHKNSSLIQDVYRNSNLPQFNAYTHALTPKISDFFPSMFKSPQFYYLNSPISNELYELAIHTRNPVMIEACAQYSTTWALIMAKNNGLVPNIETLITKSELVFNDCYKKVYTEVYNK